MSFVVCCRYPRQIGEIFLKIGFAAVARVTKSRHQLLNRLTKPQQTLVRPLGLRLSSAAKKML